MTRTIAIKTVLNGFVVKVGCQTVVFTSRVNLINHLDQYLKTEDTYQFERTFLDDAVNARKLGFGSGEPTPETPHDVAPPVRNTRALDEAFDEM